MSPEWLVAGSTVALALITAYYAWHTARISKASDQTVAAALRSAEAAERQTLLSARPTLLEASDLSVRTVNERSEKGAAARDKDIPREFSITLQNVGPGPVLNAHAAVILEGVGFEIHEFKQDYSIRPGGEAKIVAQAGTERLTHLIRQAHHGGRTSRRVPGCFRR